MLMDKLVKFYVGEGPKYNPVTHSWSTNDVDVEDLYLNVTTMSSTTTIREYGIDDATVVVVRSNSPMPNTQFMEIDGTRFTPIGRQQIYLGKATFILKEVRQNGQRS